MNIIENNIFWANAGHLNLPQAAERLAKAELAYRHACEHYGVGDSRTQQAWDIMRDAGMVLTQVLDTPRTKFFELISAEVERAYTKHGKRLWGRHEFHSILEEEYDELWDDIKADAPAEQMTKELIQVAAMCMRFFETGNRYKEQIPGQLPVL